MGAMKWQREMNKVYERMPKLMMENESLVEFGLLKKLSSFTSKAKEGLAKNRELAGKVKTWAGGAASQGLSTLKTARRGLIDRYRQAGTRAGELASQGAEKLRQGWQHPITRARRSEVGATLKSMWPQNKRKGMLNLLRDPRANPGASPGPRGDVTRLGRSGHQDEVDRQEKIVRQRDERAEARRRTGGTNPPEGPSLHEKTEKIMNKTYERLVMMLAEQMPASPMSTAGQRDLPTKRGAGAKSVHNKFARWQAARQRSGMNQPRRQMRMASPSPQGPSLHEEYRELIDMIVEYNKKPKAYWKRMTMGSEDIRSKVDDPDVEQQHIEPKKRKKVGPRLTPRQRRKISLTNTRKERKETTKRKKVAKKRKALKSMYDAQPHKPWHPEPEHYL
jgi:hypothetical protein